MIAKAKAVAHGGNLIRYAMKEGKMDRMIASNIVSALTPEEIHREFEQVNRLNYRCENKYLRFEIGIAPQELERISNTACSQPSSPSEPKMTPEVLQTIAYDFAGRMNLRNHQ
jgi:hypothetical protein